VADARAHAATLERIAEGCDLESDFDAFRHVGRARGLGDFVRRLLDWPKTEQKAWIARAWAMEARVGVRALRREIDLAPSSRAPRSP
jgi:hypothetical protein